MSLFSVIGNFRLLMVSVYVLSASPSSPQTQIQSPTIEVISTRTIEVEAEYVDFWLVKNLPIGNIQKGLEAIKLFEKQVREAFESLNLIPKEIEISSPEFRSRSQHRVGRASNIPVPLEVCLKIKVRFHLSDLGTGADQIQRLAELHEKLREIAISLQSSLTLPRLGVYDPLPAEREAIAKAIEAAYPHGEAAADIMRSRIIAVQNVLVEEVVWENSDGDLPELFDFRKLRCKAKVRVTYVFSSIL